MDDVEDTDDKSARESKPGSPSLYKALCRTFLPYYMIGGILLLSNNLIGFINPIMLRYTDNLNTNSILIYTRFGY